MKKKLKTVYCFLTLFSVVSLNAYVTNQHVFANEVDVQANEKELASNTIDSTASNLNSSTSPSSISTEISSSESNSTEASLSDSSSSTETGASSSSAESITTQSSDELTASSVTDNIDQVETQTASSTVLTETNEKTTVEPHTVVSTPINESFQAEPSLTSSSLSLARMANTETTGQASEQTVDEPTTLINIDSKQVTFKYTGSVAEGENIKFAVWSDNQGQDDIVWYQADVTGLAYLQLKRHKSYGLYHVHTYSFASGRGPKGVGAKSFTLEKPNPKVEIEQTSATNYRLTISNVGPTISSLKVPIWSNTGGQDDIKWYDASSKADGTYQLDISTTNHKSNFGKYQVHVYGDSMVEKRMIGLTATNGFEHLDNRPEPQIQINQSTSNSTYFDVELAGKSGDRLVKEMAIAVWSDTNQQDDLKWYSFSPIDNKGKQRIWFKNHANESDNYQVHVYLTYQDGRKIGKSVGPVVFEKPETRNEVKIELTEKGFAFELDSNQVTDFTKVKFAVWSQNANQDDLKWYDADKNGSAVAAYKNHKGYGLYHVHTYTFENGKPVFINANTFTINKPSVTTKVEKVSSSEYRVTITDVPFYMSDITVPVWSRVNGQDDIVWTPAKKVGKNTYQASIHLVDHRFDMGQYHAHVYGNSLLSKKLEGLAATEGFEVSDLGPLKGTIKVSDVNLVMGTFKVTISDISSPTGLQSVLVPIWSTKNGQDDIIWYQAKKGTNGTFTVDVAASDHKYTDGTYLIHLYYKDSVGKLNMVAASNVSLNLAAVPEKLYTIGRRKFKIIGTFAPSYKSLQDLSVALDRIEGQGYGVGFKLMDINSRFGIEYNAGNKYYGASTIKGPYVASLTSLNPATTASERRAMLNILHYSSNEDYINLRSRYGSNSIYNWGSQTGIPQSSLRDFYPYLSANDLFGLWQTNYKYFNSSAKGKEVGSWFQNPNLSPIHSVLGSSYKTQTKAGWIGLPGYRSASDGGIVYTPKGNYILSIMSNADGRLGLLNPTVSALHNIHQQIKP
ncbi:TPA: GBS Bsp-like repeat-containing protein [Streptococcus suis]